MELPKWLTDRMEHDDRILQEELAMVKRGEGEGILTLAVIEAEIRLGENGLSNLKEKSPAELAAMEEEWRHIPLSKNRITEHAEKTKQIESSCTCEMNTILIAGCQCGGI